MRMSRGVSVADAYEQLTARQRRALNAVRKARDEEDAAVQEVLSRSYRATLDALNAGVPARVIADDLGISAARVYQLRDLARKELQGEKPQG